MAIIPPDRRSGKTPKVSIARTANSAILKKIEIIVTAVNSGGA
jgi:hypothetical protein